MRSFIPGLLAAGAVLASVSSAAADPRVHVVAAGDTLGALALRYHVSIEELRAWNELSDDTIRVGQPLTVEDVPRIRYRTVPGDTLSCIAQRYGVSQARLREDNPSIGRRLEVGTRLVIVGGHDPRAGDEDGATEPREHRVARGENLTRIAEQYDVTVEQLVAMNPGLEPDRLRVGRRLTVGTQAASESVGVPWCGHVTGAQQLGAHPGYVLRNPARSWATQRTIERLRRGFDELRRRDRRAPRARVHDLSLRGGGPIDDHRSHQSGRDVDITYFRRRGCRIPGGCPLERVDPEQLDVARQWMLFETWLRHDDAEAIYVDYALQGVLYREARRRGASGAQLRRWFQFPRGPRDGDGVIRHFPNHRDHFHVRFACVRGESRCR
ncbi:MAG: penicillin-insensitive murein endopeptidase [Myxococcales bacterium]|nr:penicillin-insensitive murein endopeptidase [Myxococcales bacterium]